jgi:hypothetical protein
MGSFRDQVRGGPIGGSIRRLTSALIAISVLAGIAVAAPASTVAAAARLRSCAGGQTQPVTVAQASALNGVDVASPCSAWAAGGSWNGSIYQTLIERWNGSAWHVQPTPDPGGSAISNLLAGIAGGSPSDAWAVGNYDVVVPGDLEYPRSFIVRWAGKAWVTAPSPQPGYGSTLNAVAVVVSDKSAWAVGSYFQGAYGPERTLIERWNGVKWKPVASRDIAGAGNGARLLAVTATSATKAWAVGTYNTAANPYRLLIEHWNGVKWMLQGKRALQAIANLSGILAGLTATSSASAWAVGEASGQALILHWNGTTWSKVASPPIGVASRLYSVASTPAGPNVWAAGYYDNGFYHCVIEHLAGKAWHLTFPGPSNGDCLLGSVGARPARRVAGSGHAA